jgi:ATP-binding cassette subfamily B protein
MQGLDHDATRASDPSGRTFGVNYVPPSNSQLLKWMFAFLKPVKLLCFLACFYLTVSLTIQIFIDRQMGVTVDQIQVLHGSPVAAHGFFAWMQSREPEAVRLRIVMGWLSVLTLLFLWLRYVREVANMKLSMTMVYYIREAVYDKLQRVGFAFHDAVSTGQLINRALTDLQNVRSFIQTAVLSSLDIVLGVGGYMILLLTRSPYVAALSLVPLPFWTWYILRFSKKVQPASKLVMESGDRDASIITENIAGVHVIKAFATEDQEIGKYHGNCDTYFGFVMARIRLYANFQPVIRAIGTASHLSLFFLAAVLILQNKLMIGDILILGAAMGNILGKLQSVSMISEQYQNAIVSAGRLYEVLAAPPTVREKPGACRLHAGPGDVRFENVTFGYDAAKPVLHDISFSVRGGSVVAIVGPTGAGKTTLVNLLARFYDPQGGRILIDGVDLRDIELSSLREKIAFVFQETYLFSDTVAGNIAYGRPHVTGGEIEAASRLAQAHEFVEDLPKGYDTLLGERGASLSGGQKQRLAIARAILFNPRVLVLDDATAAIDPETEDLIRRGMNVVMKDRTTFLIAHRISSVKRADLVIVLENGRVTQTGTHKQLMEQDGHYRDIAAVQLYGDNEDRDPEGDNPSHMDRARDPRRIGVVAANARGSRKLNSEEL